MGNGGRRNRLDFVFEAVFGKFQRCRAKSIRRDEISTGRGVFRVDVADDARMGEIHGIRAGTLRDVVVLEHGTHAAVKDEHKFSSFLFYYFSIFCFAKAI